jgi:hypothetical protein
MKKLGFVFVALSLCASQVQASTPRIVATCASEGLELKPGFRVVVSEIFGVPHMGYLPHFYKAEVTETTRSGVKEIGSFSAKYFPPNSNSFQSSQYYKGRNFLLKLFTEGKTRPDKKSPALLEVRAADGTDYSEKMLCSIAQLMVF